MRLIFLFFAYYLYSFTALSQSKAETTNWIISKFNKWKVVDTRLAYSELGMVIGGTSEAPQSLNFINCNLIFKTKSSYINGGGEYELITYSLNVGDIDKIEWVNAYGNDLLIIITNTRLVKQVSVSKSEYSFEQNKTNNTDTKYIDRCMIALDTKGEENFKPRMIKALNHLKSFCEASKKEKETF